MIPPKILKILREPLNFVHSWNCLARRVPRNESFIKAVNVALSAYSQRSRPDSSLPGEFRFQDLCYTWASWLIQAVVPLSALQEMGGQESIEMVRHYAHLAPNPLTEHVRKIDSLLGKSDTNTTQGGNQVGLKLA